MAWVTAAAIGVNVVGGIAQAQATEQAAQINNQVAQINAQYAELDSFNAKEQGFAIASRYQETVDQTIGVQKAGEAAGGQDVGFGTAAELGAQTKLTGYLNQLNINTQASQKALGYDVQANNIRLNGEIGVNTANVEAANAVIGGAAKGVSVGATGYGKPNTDTESNEFGNSDYSIESDGGNGSMLSMRMK